MKYTIQEILPGQIRVEFEDNSWAIVPIPPNSSLEEIDNAVSQYDPDFLPSVAESINPDISVGVERTSVQKVEEQKVEEPKREKSPPSDLSSKQSFLQNLLKLSLQNYLIAEHFASLGDNRLKELIAEKIKKLVESPDFSLENIIFNMSMSDDDILKQAEEELNNGK